MKAIAITALAAFAALTSTAGFDLPDGYKRMTSAKRVCVKREVIEIGGEKFRVTHWNRDGRPDWIKPPVETNSLAHVKGKKQNNAIENARQEAEADAAPARAVKKAAKNAAKKDLKNLQNAIKDLKKACDKSSDDMKAVYEPIIGLLEAEVNEK